MNLRLIGVLSKNREEYLELDLACTLYNINMIAIYDTLGADAVEHIFNQTELSTVFCSQDFIEKLIMYSAHLLESNFGSRKTKNSRVYTHNL